MTIHPKNLIAVFAILAAVTAHSVKAQTPANPLLLNYGFGEIVADPQYPIVGQTTTISVRVNNDGDAAATNVQVKISFNDWGVTFNGWQQIGTIQTIPSIPGHGSATVTVTKVFTNRTHTCVEALIVGADADSNPNDDRGQINLEVINAGETFGYNVPVGNEGQQGGNFGIEGVAHAGGAAGQIRILPVKVEPAVLALAPGEFKNVKVELDLTGLPANTPVQLMVQAVNLDPMSSLEDRNNVIFEINVKTAYQLKSDILADLQAIRNDLPNRNLKNRVSAAMTAIRGSQNNRFWNGENRLHKKRGGAAVFALETAAILSLESVLKSNISLALKKRVDEAIRNICDADRILAETAIKDANNPAAAVNKRIDGDNHRQRGQYADAARDYAKAWGMTARP